jgi:GGDEF domain-containing protein
LRACVSHADTVVRFDGDEFVLMVFELGFDWTESHLLAAME